MQVQLRKRWTKINVCCFAVKSTKKVPKKSMQQISISFSLFSFFQFLLIKRFVFLYSLQPNKSRWKIMTPSTLFPKFFFFIRRTVGWQVWECQAWGVKGFEVTKSPLFFNFSSFLFGSNFSFFFLFFGVLCNFFFRFSLWPSRCQNLTGSWICLAPLQGNEKKSEKKSWKSIFFTLLFLTSFSLLVASYSIKSFRDFFFVFFLFKNANIDICPKALKWVNMKFKIYGKIFVREFLLVGLIFNLQFNSLRSFSKERKICFPFCMERWRVGKLTEISR